LLLLRGKSGESLFTELEMLRHLIFRKFRFAEYAGSL
jgi:hypothetical protein